MKKIALAIAVLAATAGAQAADIYGTADIGYNYFRSAGTPTHALISGGQSDSYIGLKAGEDLGSGVKATVTLEAGYNLDTGATSTGNLFNREASIALSSGANTVKAGRLQSLGYASVKQFDAFGGGNLGLARGISPVAEYANNTLGYGYSQGDFKAGLQHSFGEQANNFSALSTNAMSVGYSHGPVSAALTHTRVNAGARTSLAAGAYDFGVAKASLMYQKASNSVLNHSYLVGVRAPIAGVVAIASVGQAKLTAGNTVDLYSVGGEYSLSKRTNLYAAYGRAEGLATAQSLAVGLNHSF